MLELRRMTGAIVPLSKLGATYGKSLLELFRHKLCSFASFSGSCSRDPLPWEVTEKQRQKYQDLEKAGVVCDDCKPQSVLDQFRSILERRRTRKCLEEGYSRQKCQNIELELSITGKSYPYFHAEVKGSLPGAPISTWQELNKPDRYKDLPCC